MHGKWRLAAKKFRRIRGIGLIMKIKQKVSDKQISKYYLILREKHEKILITSEYQIDEKEYRILMRIIKQQIKTISTFKDIIIRHFNKNFYFFQQNVPCCETMLENSSKAILFTKKRT